MNVFGYTANGTQCSRLVFGAWAIGGAFTGKVDDKESLNTLAFAFENGLSFFDTAPVYGKGHSERLLGQFIQNKRAQVFIATKGGISWKTHSSGQLVMEPDGSSINLKRELEASLRRLKTDYIDLYQLHWPDSKTDIAETFETFTQFQSEGLFRFIGVSNFGLSQLKQAKKYAEIIALQNQYNLLSRKVETDILPFIEQQDMYFLYYGSLAYGILTGKFYPSYPFTENDWRKTGISPTNHYFIPSNFEHHLKQVNQLKVLAEELHCSPAQLAIAWLLRHPRIYPLVGAKTIEQTKNNIQSLHIHQCDL